MKPTLTALFAVAKELAELAKSSIPKLREGETVRCEWLNDGIYCRETNFNGVIYQATFDFKQRVSRIIAV